MSWEPRIRATSLLNVNQAAASKHALNSRTLHRLPHFAGRRCSASAIACSGFGANRDRPSASIFFRISPASRAPRGSPNGCRRAESRWVAHGGHLPGRQIQPSALNATGGELRNVLPKFVCELAVDLLGASGTLSAAKPGGSAPRHLDQLRSSRSASKAIRSSALIASGSDDGVDFRHAGFQAKHSAEPRHRAQLRLPDRQPWRGLVLDDIGGGQLTGCDALGNDGPRVGGEQRQITVLEMIRATGQHEIHEQTFFRSGEIDRRAEPGCCTGRRERDDCGDLRGNSRIADCVGSSPKASDHPRQTVSVFGTVQ